jgi:4-carboxymuconolactone decarboxylase
VEAAMTTLEERFQASQSVLARLGRADANGVPLGNAMMEEIAPDQWRLIREACFGFLWTRPGLSMEQRSLATISIITVLRRDDNLKGHIHSGLDVGLTAEQIVEVMLQLIFYVGAPIANTALRVANDVFKERGVRVTPYQVYNPNEAPEVLYQRGLAKRREVMGETFAGDFEAGDEVDRDWERYLLEYLWGSVWTRPGLDVTSRCLCTLSALTVVSTERALGNYIRAALRLGFSAAQIKELFFHLSFYTGVSLARRGAAITTEVSKSR